MVLSEDDDEVILATASPFFESLGQQDRTVLASLFNQAMVYFTQDTDAVKRDVIGKFTPTLSVEQCDEVFQFLLAAGEFGEDNSGSTETWTVITHAEASPALV